MHDGETMWYAEHPQSCCGEAVGQIVAMIKESVSSVFGGSFASKFAVFRAIGCVFVEAFGEFCFDLQ